ncbi:hypothetical protein B0H10DRAFT_1938837 [Mycena sp. CBHHK59/15]|nr:hypothetical protein B0H10DRAFT_1938837 [Mycena sp. CBHHK59/15]
MASSSKFASLHFNKQKHEDSAGEPRPLSQLAHMLRSPIRPSPDQRQCILNVIAASGTLEPPPTALEWFREIYSVSLLDYKSSQTALQKAVATQSKFGLSSSNGAVPVVISHHIKLPVHQPLKGAKGTVDDTRVVEAKTALERHGQRYDYCYQVEHFQAQVNITMCADKFVATLTTYAKRIFQSTGDADLTSWQPCIALVKPAFLAKIKTLKLEFVAHLDKEFAAREAKADAVATARADTEMAEATKPIADIVTEKIKLLLPQAIVKENKKSTKQVKPLPSNEAASSSKATASKPKPSTLSTTKSTTVRMMARKTEMRRSPLTTRKRRNGRGRQEKTERRCRTRQRILQGKEKAKPQSKKNESSDNDLG